MSSYESKCMCIKIAEKKFLICKLWPSKCSQQFKQLRYVTRKLPPYFPTTRLLTAQKCFSISSTLPSLGSLLIKTFSLFPRRWLIGRQEMEFHIELRPSGHPDMNKDKQSWSERQPSEEKSQVSSLFRSQPNYIKTLQSPAIENKILFPWDTKIQIS